MNDVGEESMINKVDGEDRRIKKTNDNQTTNEMNEERRINEVNRGDKRINEKMNTNQGMKKMNEMSREGRE